MQSDPGAKLFDFAQDVETLRQWVEHSAATTLLAVQSPDLERLRPFRVEFYVFHDQPLTSFIEPTSSMSRSAPSSRVIHRAPAGS